MTPLFILLQLFNAGLLFYRWASLSIWSIVWFGLYCSILNKLKGMIVGELEQGLTPGYTLDVFATIAASQLVNLISSFYANVVLCVIPCYLIYKFGGIILAYCCP